MKINTTTDGALPPVRVNGKTITWNLFHGRVLGLRRFSRTYVDGGGGIHNGNGTINISSTVVTTTEFHVRDNDGSEVSQWINWDGLPLRDGQSVTLLWGNDVWLGLVNHDLGKWWYLQPPKEALVGVGAFRWPRYWWFLLLLSPFLLTGAILPVLVGTVGLCWLSRGLQRLRIRWSWPRVRERLEAISRAALTGASRHLDSNDVRRDNNASEHDLRVSRPTV